MTELPGSMKTLEIYLEKPRVQLGECVTELPRLSHALLLQLALATPDPLNIETLRTRVWAGIHVGDDTVKQRVKLLRAALSNAGIERGRIETVTGQGYQLIGPFKIIDSYQSPRVESQSIQKPVSPLIAGSIGVIVTAFLLYFFFLTDAGRALPDTSDDIRLAVMPFSEADESPVSSAIRTGFREELMGLLARHEGISSVAASSVDAIRSVRVADVGELLDVDAVVEANIRSDNEQRRLSIRLIDTDTEVLIWSGEFGQPSHASLKEWSRVVHYVTKQMFLELESQMPMARPGGTEDGLAYQHYLEGMHYLKKPFDKEAYEQAIQKFELALARDDKLLLARAKLAESHLYMALHGYAEKEDVRGLVESTAALLEENTELSESQFAYGLALHLVGEKEQADQLFRKAEKDRPYLKWDIRHLN